MFRRNDTLIAELKQQRCKALTTFHEISIIKNEELAEFFFSQFQIGEDVPFALLIQMPENEAIPLPVVHGGWILTTRKAVESNGEDKILYETKWSAGSTLTWHFHSDCNEKITVRTGKIKVYANNNVNILIPGQSIEIGYGIGHQITAIEETTLDINFIKININAEAC